MKPEDRKRLKQHIEMIVEHKEPDEIVRENFKKLQDEVADLREKNIKLRLELHTLRFKESQEQRFIWWVYNVYSKNVCDLIYEIMGATTYDTEGEAKEGKYALPKRCFDLMKRIDEYTEHIYDGSYLDVEISTAVKTSTDNNKLDIHTLEYAAKWIENSLVGETNERVIEFGKNMAMSIRAAKPSISDVSMTQDVLTDVKTPRSIENNNPDYYKDDVGKWIPIASGRLPEKFQECIVLDKNNRVHNWIHDDVLLPIFAQYTHWMPLPEPPEVEE